MLKVAVTVFALANLLYVTAKRGLLNGTSIDWALVVCELLGFTAMGLTCWALYIGLSIGAIPLLLALFRGGGTGVELLIIIPCLIATAVKATRWRLLVVTTICTAWSITFALVCHQSLAGWTAGTTVLLSVLAGLVLRHFIIDRVATKQNLKQAEQQLDHAEQRLAHAEVSQQRARKDERVSLARELHDGLSHELAIISTQAQAYAKDENADNVRRALDRSGKASRAALNELKVLLKMLRDPSYGQQLLTQAPPTLNSMAPIDLEGTVAEVRAALQDSGFRPVMTINVEPFTLSVVQQTTMARFLKECSTNIIKYAEPHTACTFIALGDSETLILWASSQLRSTVGSGSPLSAGLGLVGLAERVRLLNGVFQACPDNGQWNTRAAIPRQ